MKILDKIYQSSPHTVQTLLLNGKAAELYFERYGSKFNRTRAVFEKNQYLSREQIAEYQNRKLTEIINHAYQHVPYYNELFKSLKLKPEDIKCAEDLQKLPILTKDIINNNFERLKSVRSSKYFTKKGNTSGTTGTPLNVLYDINTCVVHHVADWRQKQWAGLEMGDAYASLQGRLICSPKQSKPPFWRKNHVNNQMFLSSFHLKKQYLQSYVDMMKHEGILFLEGYPSTLYTLAAFLVHTNQSLPLKAVLTSSETLYEWQRSTLMKAFECNVFDFYGMAERVVYATECKEHKGKHLNEDYGISEFLDSNNEPVVTGKFGKLVATTLHNSAFPLIRYQTNDTCALTGVDCNCGVTFKMMHDVTTKSEAIITLPDGRWISPSVLTHPFKPMVNIVESQIHQSDLHNVVVKIVKKDTYTDKDEKILVKGLSERLGQDVTLRVDYVDSVERTRSGKFKWVTSDVVARFD